MNETDFWNSVKDFFDKSWWQSLVFSVGSFVLGYFISWYKRNSIFVLSYLRHFKSLFAGKKYVLVWNDHSIDTSENIVSILKEKQPDYRYRPLDKADKLLAYPLLPKFVHAVIVIVTDVTKLSDVEEKREAIQSTLVKYVRKGGTLIGTHDVIYRRCRNKTLQDAFGCEICNFQRVSQPIPVSVVEMEKEHPLVRNLPANFEIDDGEVCWGEWSHDAKVLIRTRNEFSNNTDKRSQPVPMLVVRHTGDIGTLIWMNSADKNERLSRSLGEPQAPVIQIMENAIEYSKEIKEYYKASVKRAY
jgi:glycerophosphoryl diester phosphodiesterase